MSHAASHYVKHLVTAPNGERITAPEKAVLGQLADDHREEAGVAWPSVGSLAMRACLSERQCRRVLAECERKGVILRLPTAREKDLGQSSNEYIFCQLDPPPIDRKTMDENRRRLQATPRSRMTGGGGHPRPGAPDIHVLPPRSSASAPPGHGCPPIDTLRDPSDDSSGTLPSDPNLPLPLPRGGRGNREDRGAVDLRRCEALFAAEELAADPTRADALWAVVQVCGEHSLRVAAAVKAQFDQERGRRGVEIATAMRASWLEYARTGHLLRFHWAARNFFGKGHWRRQNLWPYDQERLRQYRNARVGS